MSNPITRSTSSSAVADAAEQPLRTVIIKHPVHGEFIRALPSGIATLRVLQLVQNVSTEILSTMSLSSQCSGSVKVYYDGVTFRFPLPGDLTDDQYIKIITVVSRSITAMNGERQRAVSEPSSSSSSPSSMHSVMDRDCSVSASSRTISPMESLLSSSVSFRGTADHPPSNRRRHSEAFSVVESYHLSEPANKRMADRRMSLDSSSQMCEFIELPVITRNSQNPLLFASSSNQGSGSQIISGVVRNSTEQVSLSDHSISLKKLVAAVLLARGYVQLTDGVGFTCVDRDKIIWKEKVVTFIKDFWPKSTDSDELIQEACKCILDDLLENGKGAFVAKVLVGNSDQQIGTFIEKTALIHPTHLNIRMKYRRIEAYISKTSE